MIFISSRLPNFNDISKVIWFSPFINISMFPNITTTKIIHVYRCEITKCELFLPEHLPSGATTINMRWCYQVNSVVETWVNESLSYLDFSIKGETPFYRVTVTKRVIIPIDWPKPRDRTIVCRYVIMNESEESNRNCKFLDNVVFGW